LPRAPGHYPAAPPSLALLAELEKAGAISVIGLHLAKPDLPYDQYESLCYMLGRLHEAARFAIGDAIILGENLYHELAYQAIESMQLSEDARREYVRVAAQVPRSIRRPDLSWSHHRAVAALEPPEQRKWLRTAAEADLSHHALRDALRDGALPDPPKICRCCHRPLDA
jgi:hypothetical protein